jgi:hypothetical protein
VKKPIRLFVLMFFGFTILATENLHAQVDSLPLSRTRGVAEFSKGRVVRVLGASDSGGTDFWFTAAANQQLGHEKHLGELEPAAVEQEIVLQQNPA